MAKMVEKYRKHSYATMDPNQSAKDLQVYLLSPYMNYQKTDSNVLKLETVLNYFSKKKMILN